MEKDINKMQEDIVNADMKQADKIWKVMEENLSLEYHLDRMTKDELVKVAAQYKVKGITSLKKADAVIKVKNSIIEKIDITLDLLNDEGFSYLQNLINGNCIESCENNELINTTYLRNRGILFTGIIDENLKVILPIEVSELIKIKLTKELKENTLRNTEIVKLFAGMVYYYGVLTIDKFIELAESTLEYDIDYERVEMIINNGEELGFDYQIEGNMAVHIDVEEVSEIIEAQERNCEIGYYKFDKKALIKAAKPDFIEENKQALKLEKVIGELFVIDKKILKEEIESYSIAIKNEEPLDACIDVYLRAYQIEADEERNIFSEELTKLANSVRRWSYKGYSQTEIDNKKKTVVVEVKVGRNDVCICGSGKKYKKCCGR
ncbi:SEC-C domain-containing protein [Clostridium gasigenes]|uniref:SEC-C domain-containing protein n=1 Tax=Clostridium gasigenes TaxID=94869 RepID=UPI0025B7956A|nr:SEC-C domain-containing protein [Clostridium gasigenes]